MRHPLWIVNSSLLALLLISFLIMFFMRQPIPPREKIKPKKVQQPVVTTTTAKINISKIYESDLFGTYQKEFAQPTDQRPLASIPEPPRPTRAQVPEIPKPQFIDPIKATLKGIIVIGDDESQSRAIIADTKTNKESVFKVGDLIEDAQLIRIFSNKVIFVRSNGQQELLYLRESDAKMDPIYSTIRGWEQVIKRVTETQFSVYPQEFIERVPSLANFIDALDLTTVYQKGVSVGCRIGSLSEHSLGQALGFITGDIITMINNIAATDTQNRFMIYKDVIAQQLGQTITVEFVRNGHVLTFKYTLEQSPRTLQEGIKKEAATRIKEQEDIAEQEWEETEEMVQHMQRHERTTLARASKSPAQRLTSKPAAAA